MSKINPVLLMILWGLLSVAGSHAEELRVGFLPDTPPYVQLDNHAHPGIAIELWREIATQNKWTYRFIPQIHSERQALKALQNDEIDVLVGAISVNHYRMKTTAFSRPYFIARIGLLMPEQTLPFLSVIQKIFYELTDIMLLAVFILMLVFAHIFWLIARRANLVPKTYWRGLGTSIWNVFVTLFSSDYKFNNDIVALRILTVLMLFSALFVSSLVIATFSSAFTVSFSHQKPITTLHDIGQKAVAAVKGTANVAIAEGLSLRTITVESIEEGLALAKEGKVLGVILPIPQAKHFIKRHPYENMYIPPLVLNYDEVTFAFNKSSRFIRPFDITLTKLQDDNRLASLCETYFGKLDAQLCAL